MTGVARHVRLQDVEDIPVVKPNLRLFALLPVGPPLSAMVVPMFGTRALRRRSIGAGLYEQERGRKQTSPGR